MLINLTARRETAVEVQKATLENLYPSTHVADTHVADRGSPPSTVPWGPGITQMCPVCSQVHKLLLNLREVCTSTNSLLCYGVCVAAHTYMFTLELEDFPRNTTRKVFYSGSEEPGGGNSGEGSHCL